MINQIIKGMLFREEVAEGLRERGLAVSKANMTCILHFHLMGADNSRLFVYELRKL